MDYKIIEGDTWATYKEALVVAGKKGYVISTKPLAPSSLYLYITLMEKPLVVKLQELT